MTFSLYDFRLSDFQTFRHNAFPIKNIVGFRGDLYFDTSMPEGTPRKLLNIQVLKNNGWFPSIDLKKGIFIFYDNYKKL